MHLEALKVIFFIDIDLVGKTSDCESVAFIASLIIFQQEGTFKSRKNFTIANYHELLIVLIFIIWFFT